MSVNRHLIDIGFIFEKLCDEPHVIHGLCHCVLLPHGTALALVERIIHGLYPAKCV